MQSPEATQSLIQTFKDAGQGQVFRFFETLEASEQQALLRQAESIDLEEVAMLVDTHLGTGKQAGIDPEGLTPAPYEPLPEHGGDPGKWTAAWEAGAAALREGRVAAFTVAGGQGTRLGYDGPKGTYPVTPVSQKSLFEVFAGKIARSAERFGAPIHWFILTSEINHAATIEAFQANDFFGLDRETVHFIVQGLVPAVDYDGKILLAEEGRIAMTPDGHGGSLRALARSGATQEMAKLGIDIVSYFQVDNPIVQCIDPAFIGFHVLGRSELSSKMVAKAYPEEKVGMFCRKDGTTVVIEYSDMPLEMQRETDGSGRLKFVAGSVAIHCFDRAFIERVGGDSADVALPFHRADKKIPHIDAHGNRIEPAEPNGVKFEMFVFDALPMAKNPVIIEAARKDDFSPVKNAEGLDSPKTCREDQLRMFADWLKAAGVSVECDTSGLPTVSFEISPRFAVDRADFVEQWSRLDPKPTIKEGTIIQ